MTKEYGKLTENQFRRLVKQLPEFRKEAEGVREAFRNASKEKLREVLGDGVWWAPVYEWPLQEGLAFLVYVLGQGERLKEISEMPDPQEALISEAENDSALSWDGGPGGVFTKGDVVALVTALQHNVMSIMLYKQSLSSLIAEAREEKDESLFKAIRVDPTAVTCPTAAERISKAHLFGEKRFFLRLISALKGPPKKLWEGYRDLRYSLAILRELGFDQLSDAQLEHLLVDVLQVYPKSFTARKNLRKQYYESKRIKTL